MNKLFRLLIASAFFNALCWVILIPTWQYPDEQAHFAQVQDLAELGHVPATQANTSAEINISEVLLDTSRDVFGNNKFTYHPEYKIDYSNDIYGLYEATLTNLPKSARTTLVKYESTQNPPLYYLWASIFYRIFSNGDLLLRVYASRLSSLILFLSLIYLSFKVGKLIFSESKIMPVVLASLVAYKPMLIFSSTGVLPDSLSNLLFTIILYLSIKILYQGIKLSTLFAIVVAIFLGVMSRQQLLLGVFIIAAPITYRLLRSKFYKNSIFWKVTLVLLILALILKNQIHYFVSSSSFRIPEYQNFKIAAIFNSQLIEYLAQFFKKSIRETLPWYWGIYKWLSLALPHIFYRIINRLIILSAIGIIIKLFLIIRQKRPTKNDLAFLFLIYSSIIYVLIFAIWDYFFILNHSYSFGFQGRYFFPLVVAHVAILLIGLSQLFQLFFKKYSKYLVFLLVLLMIIFNDLSLYHVTSSYYDTSSIGSFVIQASQYKPVFFKGNAILIIITVTITLQLVFIFQFAKYINKNYENA